MPVNVSGQTNFAYNLNYVKVLVIRNKTSASGSVYDLYSVTTIQLLVCVFYSVKNTFAVSISRSASVFDPSAATRFN